MPVARIYTRFPAESAVIAARLRNHGYTIEIVDPGDFRVTPADLEIQLDRLRTGEALVQATRFARERDAEIFVGTGLAFDDEAHRALEGAGAAQGLFGPVTRLIRRVRRIGAESHAVRAARRQQKLNLELAREAERKQRAEQKASQRDERERREREAEAQRVAEREALLARQREAEQQRAAAEQQRAAEREALLARQQEEEALRAAERQKQEAEQRQQEEVQRREHAAAAARLASEQEERRRVEAEAARLEHERQVELMARVAEQRRLAEQERIAEAAALAETKRPEVEAKRPAAEVRPAVAPIAKPRMVPPAIVAREGENSRATKRAFVAAAVIAILAAIGWGAYENRMPASPLSNADRVRSGAIQQEVPFGAATIKPAAQPPANTVRPPAQQARVTPKKAQSKPSPQASKPAATRPRHKQRFADDSDMIATDEVVYHGAPKKPANATGKPTSTQNAQNVKKISDIGDQ